MQTDDLLEAVFRYQFENNHSGQQQDAKVCCLSIRINGEITGREADPTAEFLKRFEGYSTPVVKASTCTRDVREGVKHKDTGARGLILRVSGVRWKDEKNVEVEGGYYEAGLSSSGNTYRLEKQGDSWVVTEDVLNWIS